MNLRETSTPSPIVAIYQALTARHAKWYVEMGQPHGPSWIPGTALRTAREGPFHALLARIGEQTQGLPWVRQFFAGNDVVAQMQPQFYPVTYPHMTHVYHRGASCCRYYLLRQGHYCARCPLVSQEQRVERQQAWMKHLIEEP